MNLKKIFCFIVLLFVVGVYFTATGAVDTLAGAAASNTISDPSICRVAIFFVNDNTETDNGNAAEVGLFTQAVYHKTMPCIVSGYTLQRYLKNSVITNAEYQKQKDVPFAYIEHYEKMPQQAKTTQTIYEKYKKITKEMTIAEYLKYLKKKLSPGDPGNWIFKEKAMQLTSDQWTIYKKNNSIFYLLIPKNYLVLKKAKSIADIGFDISACTDVTKQVNDFNLLSIASDKEFDDKYPADLKPPTNPSDVNMDDIKALFIPAPKPVTLPENENDPKFQKALKQLEKPTLRWIVYLGGHGYFAPPVAQELILSEKGFYNTKAQWIAEYKYRLRTFSNDIAACEQFLTMLKEGKSFTYSVTDDATQQTTIMQANAQEIKQKIAQIRAEKEVYEKSSQEALSNYRKGMYDREVDIALMEKFGVRASTALIAGLSFNNFQKFLSLLNNHIQTLFLYYSTCYAGGLNRLLVNEVLKNIRANYIVAVGALTDAVVGQAGALRYLQSSRNAPIKLTFRIDLNKFFNTLEAYFTFEATEEAIKRKAQKEVSLENALKHTVELTAPELDDPVIWTNNAPFVRMPNGDSFSAANVDAKVYHLTNVRAKALAIENKALDVSDKDTIFLSAPSVTTPITINQACFSSILPPPAKTKIPTEEQFIATHYFKKIISNLNIPVALDLSLQSILKFSTGGPFSNAPLPPAWNFYYITVGTMTSGNYKNSGIEAKNPSLNIESLSIELRRTGLITMTMTIMFVYNGQGYFYQGPYTTTTCTYQKMDQSRALINFQNINMRIPGQETHKVLTETTSSVQNIPMPVSQPTPSQNGGGRQEGGRHQQRRDDRQDGRGWQGGGRHQQRRDDRQGRGWQQGGGGGRGWQPQQIQFIPQVQQVTTTGGMLKYVAVTMDSLNNFEAALAYNFLIGVGVFTKRFLIEEFSCLGGTPITKIIVEAKKTPLTTIKWIDNAVGYKKIFDIKESDKVEDIIATMNSTAATAIPQEDIIKEFEALKKAAQPEEVAPEVALKGEFFKGRAAVGKNRAAVLAGKGRTAVAEEYLKKNAIENAIDPNTGQSMLRIAVAANDLKKIRILLLQGADSSKQDKDGKTAFDIALRNRNIGALRIFVSFNPALKDKISDQTILEELKGEEEKKAAREAKEKAPQPAPAAPPTPLPAAPATDATKQLIDALQHFKAVSIELANQLTKLQQK